MLSLPYGSHSDCQPTGDRMSEVGGITAILFELSNGAMRPKVAGQDVWV